jgi:hypothetical protein
MIECMAMIFGTRAKNSRCIYALLVNKTFNTYIAGLQKLANKQWRRGRGGGGGGGGAGGAQLTQKSSKVKLRLA